MKNNSAYPVVAAIVAAIAAALYAVLYVTGTAPLITPLATTGVWVSLLAMATLALIPLTCQCKKDGMCRVVKTYVPAVLIAAAGNLAGSALLQLFTAATRLSTTISQIMAVFFGVFLVGVWALFIYEVIKAAVCPDKKCKCDNKPPLDDCDDFAYSDKKYKY